MHRRTQQHRSARGQGRLQGGQGMAFGRQINRRHAEGVGDGRQRGATREGRAAVAALIKQALLLAHHSQPAVVQHQDFHVQAEFRQGRQFLHVHQQTAVAGDAQRAGFGLRQGCADRGRQAEAHGAESARGQPAGFRPERIVLGRPHLVLADIGGQAATRAGRGGRGDQLRGLQQVQGEVGRHCVPLAQGFECPRQALR
jgi:hypothetical protein